MTQESQVVPYQRTPSAIRSEVFTHRMRGLDEAEVREYLDLLAEQIEAGERDRDQLQNEISRLRVELEQARASTGEPDEINPQAVLLLSQAQQVADQLVEEAVMHARDLMTSARNQQREILEQAQRAAQEAVAGNGAALAPSRPQSMDYSKPVPEVEYVRTFAQVAQAQLRAVLDALGEQVDRLDEVPWPERNRRPLP